MILPKPGSEVLIAFASGDFAHPYVIGGLWDQHDTPKHDDDSPDCR
jgi:uncharacterized protein involved in type VI secretion and phage assembly